MCKHLQAQVPNPPPIAPALSHVSKQIYVLACGAVLEEGKEVPIIAKKTVLLPVYRPFVNKCLSTDGWR